MIGFRMKKQGWKSVAEMYIWGECSFWCEMGDFGWERIYFWRKFADNVSPRGMGTQRVDCGEFPR